MMLKIGRKVQDMSLYTYESLDTQRREIRLCTLLPGFFDEPVACALSVVSLNDKPEYESLSYAWGSPVFDRELVVKESRDGEVDGLAAGSLSAPGFILKVTTSLHTAFRYLRRLDRTRVIWADAVCINQNDLNERSSQVTFMGDIYKSAKGCQIWLGTVEEIKNLPDESIELDVVMVEDYPYFQKFLRSQGILTNIAQLPSAGSVTASPDDSISGALEIMRHLQENKHLYEMPFWRYEESAAADIYFVGTWYKCLRTLLSIVSQPWWERVWIVQEAIRSSTAVLNLGRHQVPLCSFFPAARNYQIHVEGCCKTWTRIWHGRSDDIFLPLLPKMRLVKDLGKIIDDHAAGKLVPISLALLSQERKATDPLDHFYAITGLMTNPFNGLPLGPIPDYRKKPSDLFREQTVNLMQQSRSIAILDGAIGVGVPNPLGLASWVWDWSRSRAVGWRSSLYNASVNHEQQFWEATDDKLTILGASVGVVAKLGDLVNSDDLEDIRTKVEQWQNLAGADQPFDVRTILRATFLDMIMPHEGQHRRLTPADLTLLEEWWQEIKDREHPPGPLQRPDIWATHACFRYHMNRARVFAMREGLFGVGPRTIAVGDRIFVVLGSRVPLILRAIEGAPFETLSTSIGSDYAYVGRCYLHGVMDGEAVTPGLEWQALHLH